MKRPSFLLLVIPGVLGTLSVTRRASALGPVDVEVAVKVGGASSPSNTPQDAGNALGYGGGVRAGVVLSGVYAGVSVVALVGPENVAEPGPPGVIATSTSLVGTLMTGAEVGYGIGLTDAVTVRALVGVGNIVNQTLFVSNPNLYVEPGLTTLVNLPARSWFVGLDANLLILPNTAWGNGWETDLALTMHGQAGYRF